MSLGFSEIVFETKTSFSLSLQNVEKFSYYLYELMFAEVLFMFVIKCLYDKKVSVWRL